MISANVISATPVSITLIRACTNAWRCRVPIASIVAMFAVSSSISAVDCWWDEGVE